MRTVDPLQRKITFLLYNYKDLKKGYRTTDNAEMFIGTSKKNATPIGYINIPLGLRVIDELLNYYKIEGKGTDEFINLYYFQHHGLVWVTGELYISEKTGFNLCKRIVQKGVEIAQMLNFK